MAAKRKPDPPPLLDATAADYAAGYLFDVLCFGEGRRPGVGPDKTVAVMGAIQLLVGERLSDAFWDRWQDTIEFGVEASKQMMARMKRAGDKGYDPDDPEGREICYQYFQIHDLGMDPIKVRRGGGQT